MAVWIQAELDCGNLGVLEFGWWKLLVWEKPLGGFRYHPNGEHDSVLSSGPPCFLGVPTHFLILNPHVICVNRSEGVNTNCRR